MTYKMYSIHDSAVKIYLPPHYARTHGEAERNFVANVNNQENGHLFNSPGNFNLMYVGTYNDETGMTSAVVPELVISGLQVKQNASDDVNQLRLTGT